MSNADRIEELRTRYEENPRRYFAPLANEFRKAGDLARAIAICREHLPRQPGHMSGYIVFGQTLFEANSLDEARSVFEQALALDPENLIALKHLGDIARMNGENSVARRWYARVLDADPRNDDIASQLASLGAPTPAVAVRAVVEEPAPPPEPMLEDKPGVFATFDPSSLLDVPDDVVEMAGTTARAHEDAALSARHEPLDLDFPDDPEPAADEAFEEGILAPQWPDTSELVARLLTPVRSATPLSVPATVEAVAAFGRETSDPVEPASIDVPVTDELVEAFLPADVAPQATANVSNSFMAELEAAEFEPAAGEPSDINDFEVTAEYAIPGNWTPDALIETPVAEETGERWDVPDFVDEPVALPVPVPTFDAEGEPSFEMIDESTSEFANEFANESTSEFTNVLTSESTGGVVADQATTAVPEESYAELSSELETERVEADFAAETEFAETEFAETEFAETAAQAATFVVADAVAEPVHAEQDEYEKAPTFVTETMGELLVSQGFVSRAIEVYGELVRRRPHDPVLVARLEELRTTEQGELKCADELIAQHRALETPATTPLYSTALRATPVFTLPPPTSGQFNAPLTAQQAFRTARERFAELASRRVARRTPTHATAVADDQADGLATLFGTSQLTTTDELAARALAEAFGPVQDSGESLFDPAPMPTPTVPLRALTPRHATAGHTPGQTNSAHRSDRPPASDYSFDKFFPDPAMTNRDAPTVHSSVSGAQDSSPPVNEDLAQFSAWLKGLNNA